LDEVEWRGGGHDQQPPLDAMAFDDLTGEGRHCFDQDVSRRLTGGPDRLTVPPGGSPGGLAGEHHARPGFTDKVEHPIDDPLTWDRLRTQDSCLAQSVGDDRTT